MSVGSYIEKLRDTLAHLLCRLGTGRSWRGIPCTVELSLVPPFDGHPQGGAWLVPGRFRQAEGPIAA